MLLLLLLLPLLLLLLLPLPLPLPLPLRLCTRETREWCQPPYQRRIFSSAAARGART